MDLRVFLVEDLRGMRSLLGDLFASIGSLRLVGAAVTEAEAKLWLDENPGGWDLVIVDLVLEQGSGIGVIDRARQLSATGRIAVFSSYVTPALREHCARLGADAIFDKSETVAFIGWLDRQVHGAPPPPDAF